MEEEGGEQSREEGAANGSTDPTDRPLVRPPCDAYRSRPALVSSFLTNRGDTALSEEGRGQPEAKQHLKAVPGGREARGCGCLRASAWRMSAHPICEALAPYSFL